MDWLNYHHLQYFWVVAHEGSVRRAAELLHVTPATVSLQIRELEKSLGVRLFRREGRSLVLTDTGEAVRRYAQDIFALGQELVDMVRGRPLGQPMHLRVGVKDAMPKLVAHQFLEPTLRGETMRLVCVEGELEQLVADLSIHKLDVVLSDTPLAPTMKVKAYSHLLGESDVVLVAHRKWADRLVDGFPGTLDGAPFLLPTPDTAMRRSLDAWFAENHVRPDIRGEFQDSAMLKIAGRAGGGVFAIPAVIQSEVQAMYQVERVGLLAGLRERFYALSVERKLKHPAVVTISEAARRKLKHGRS